MTGDIFGADLLLRVGVDASGAAAEVTSKLTAAERAAVASGDRIAAGYAAGAEKATVAQLRVVAATERVNKSLRDEKATLGQRASAQASLITAQQRYTAELNKTERATLAVAGAEKSRLGGFLRQSVAAGVGIGGAQLLISQLSQAKASAIDYQDVVAANDVTFGRQRKQLEEFKRLQSDRLNLSRLTTEQLAGTFGQVFKSAGASQQQALEQGLALTERAADTRSFRGGRLEDVRDAFRSALVGETEPIRRYGVLLDDARLRLRALDLGLVKSTKDTLPPAIKAQAAYAEIMAQTADAAGDVARTADSAANKIEDQRQKAADARQELGEGLLPIISELASAGAELAPALGGVARGVAAVLSNDMARRAIYLGVAAAGVVKLTSALQDFGARTAGKISANLGLARSYDVVAGSATRAAIAEGAAVGGGVVPGRGLSRIGLAGPLIAGAGLTGSIGAATGNGGLNDLATIGGLAFTGGQIGSVFAPGIGTAIGAGLGGLLGVGAAAFGGNGTSPATTDRTPAQVRREMARVSAQIAALRQAGASGSSANPVLEAGLLQNRRDDLSTELKDATAAARETTQVVDPLTGKFKDMTKAQIEAANAAALHKTELERQRTAFQSLVNTFRPDPFAKQAVAAKASAQQIEAAELRLSAARQRARKDGATDSERASVISAQTTLDNLRAKGTESTAISPNEALARIRSNVADARDTRKDYRLLARRGASREQLDAIRSLEAASPGTLDRIAAKDGRAYTNSLDRELRKLGREAKLTARIFDEADTLAAERKGRKDAEAYFNSYVGYFSSMAGGAFPSTMPPGATAPAVLPGSGFNARQHRVNRRQAAP